LALAKLRHRLITLVWGWGSCGVSIARLVYHHIPSILPEVARVTATSTPAHQQCEQRLALCAAALIHRLWNGMITSGHSCWLHLRIHPPWIQRTMGLGLYRLPVCVNPPLIHGTVMRNSHWLLNSPHPVLIDGAARGDSHWLSVWVHPQLVRGTVR